MSQTKKVQSFRFSKGTLEMLDYVVNKSACKSRTEFLEQAIIQYALYYKEFLN